MRSILIIILLSLTFILSYAQSQVYFEVADDAGIPLVGASVTIKGTTAGTITNAEGKAHFDNLRDGEFGFTISYIGYQEYNITLRFPEDHKRNLQIALLKSGEELEEVVISTTRSSRTIIDVPTRIEVITGEELGEKAAMNSSNIGMLLKETTGVQIQQTSLSSGNISIRIQGLDGRYTQILKDGFPIYGGFSGGLSIMQIPPLDLKQVELVKGSNSTLYGGGAIAGLVNLISIVPEESPVLNIMFNQTSALGSTGNLFYAQKYGRLGFSLYSSINNQVAFDPDTDGFSNIPKAITFSINPKFYYYFNPGSELQFGFSTTYDNRTGGDMEVIKGKENDQHSFTENNLSQRYATQLLYRTSKEERSFTAKNSVSFFNRNLTVPDYEYSGEQVASFSEIVYSIYKNEDSDWQFGANHYYERFTEANTDSIPFRNYHYHTLGGFIQNTLDFHPKLTLESGLRTDYSFEYGIFILPRISLLLKANNKLTSRIGGAMGYTLPTIFTEEAEKIYLRGIAPINSDIMKAEKSLGANLDINYKTALLGKMTFSVNQMFFLTQLKNALVLRENNSMEGYYFENADGIILSSGFETNMKLTCNPMKLYVNYAFVNTELQYDNMNNQKPFTPKHNAGFVLIYEVEEKWSAGYELYYTGSQFGDLYDTKPAYWTMGIMVMKYFERVSLFINFENFTNVIQSNYEPLVLPPINNPSFPDIWAPTDGFVFNGGFKFDIL